MGSHFLEVVLYGALVVHACMAALFLVAIAIHRNDIVDVFWGAGFVVLAWWGAFTQAPRPVDLRVWMLVMMVSVWGVRLAVHIGWRTFRPGSAEDPRYATWRQEWGRSFVAHTYLRIFWVQGVLMWFVALPILVVVSQPGPPLGAGDLLGMALWLTGLAFEWLGDAQLSRWLSDPANRGKPLTTGVWAWTRHPNYFGDALVWWGIAAVALPVPMGRLGVVSALTMSLLLRFVSGVPLLEKRHRGEAAWDAYRTQVGVFLPFPPRRR